MAKKPWYVGVLAGKKIMKLTPGVADLDGSKEIYGRDPKPKVSGVRYTLAENYILMQIQKIRHNYSDKRDQLARLQELLRRAENANLSGRSADAIGDIQSAIDELRYP